MDEREDALTGPGSNGSPDLDRAAELQSEPRVTTVADNEWKARIEPYAERAPVVDIPAGVIACHFCGNTRFRRSRIRAGDVVEFLMLRLPLRCMRCNQRQYGSFLTAGIAIETKAQGPRLAKGNDTWKAWTEQESGGLHRPMSTAIGSRATKLARPTAHSQSRTEQEGRVRQPAWRNDDREIW